MRGEAAIAEDKAGPVDAKVEKFWEISCLKIYIYLPG
jgi:hypothetical protein